tara:strand:+ start:60 stop:392 length:333 start_codon:yes stop_codon:yes gene_type:complete
MLTEEEKKERNRISCKNYYDNNEEKIKEYRQSPKEKKRTTVKTWKRYGVKSEDYDLLYSNYLNSTECDNCKVSFGERGDGTNSWKCLDHSHETGEFRNFLCNYCNVLRGE